jgi:hypothetical protein
VTARTVQTYNGQSEPILRKDLPGPEAALASTHSGESPKPTTEKPGKPEKPAPEIRSTRTENAGSSSGGWGCGLLAMGGVGVAAVAAAVAVGLYLNQQPTGRSLGPSDPDWKPIAADLGVRGVAAETACNSKLGTHLQFLAVDVGVDGTGKLVDLRLTNYDYRPAQDCMAAELARQLFPRRSGKDVVRVAVSLQK